MPCQNLIVGPAVIILNYIETMSKTTIILTCQHGYIFDNNEETFVATCLYVTCTWSALPPLCVGM